MAPRFRSFLVAFFLVLYLLVVGPVALLIAWPTGSAALLFRLAVPAARFGMWLAGVRIRVHGAGHLDAANNYLFMPNHISNVDPPVVVAALRRDVRMMAKASLFRIPVFGSVLRTAGFVPIVREERDAAIGAVEEAAARLRSGCDFVVFPEGTRSRDGKLLPLKKGPFFLAQAGGVPVVPVRIRGTRDILEKGGMVIHPGYVDVEIRPPIDVSRLVGEPESVREQIRARVVAELQDDLIDQ